MDITIDLGAALAITMSAITVISTLTIPHLTAKKQNEHEQKMYEKRFANEHAHEVIEKYLQAIGRYVFEFEHKDLSIFGEAVSEIFMYIPENLTEDVKEFNEHISRISQINDYSQRTAQLKLLQPVFLDLCEKFAPLCRGSEQKKQKRIKRHRKN